MSKKITAYALIKLEKLAYVKLTGKVRQVYLDSKDFLSFDLDAKSQKIVGRKRLTNRREYGEWSREFTTNPTMVKKELREKVARLEIKRKEALREAARIEALVYRLEDAIKHA